MVGLKDLDHHGVRHIVSDFTWDGQLTQKLNMKDRSRRRRKNFWKLLHEKNKNYGFELTISPS